MAGVEVCQSMSGGDLESIWLYCLEYGGHKKILKEIVKESAQRMCLCFGLGDEDDIYLLSETIGAKGRSKMGRRGTYKLKTTLNFHIIDELILTLVGEVKGNEICLPIKRHSFGES